MDLARMRTCLYCLLGGAAGLASACLAAPPVGYVLHGPQPKGTFLINGQAGGGGGIVPGKEYCNRGGGGTVQAELFATKRLSIPMTFSAMRFVKFRDSCAYDEEMPRLDWHATGRIGLRYRVGAIATVGGGLSGDGGRWSHRFYEDQLYTFTKYDGGVSLDFEWSLGRTWRHFGISFAQRFLVRLLPNIQLISDLSLAYYPTGETFAITATTFLGLNLFSVWAGAGAGILLRY